MPRSPFAAARLDAIAAAKRLHRDLAIPELATQGAGLVDVFAAISTLDIPLVFKPLVSALGFCLPAPLRGIMVTTRRSLHIQRFTAAHELGHLVLAHNGSIDREISEDGAYEARRPRDLREVAADAFAAEFLLPRWLYRYHIVQQGWSVQRDLRNPVTIYQLSLRMGASYQATCWGLQGHQILSPGEVATLRDTPVADLKEQLGDDFRPGDSWADVWRVTSRDDGATIVGNPDDLVRLELEEAAGNGFRWSAELLQEAGFEILSDKSVFPTEPLLYGGTSTRTFVARPPAGGRAHLHLTEQQPWRHEAHPNQSFNLSVALLGRENGGLSRAERHRLGVSPVD